MKSVKLFGLANGASLALSTAALRQNIAILLQWRADDRRLIALAAH